MDKVATDRGGFLLAFHTCPRPQAGHPHTPEHESRHQLLSEALDLADAALKGSDRSAYINWEALREKAGTAYLYTPCTGDLSRHRSGQPSAPYPDPRKRKAALP